MPKRPERAGYKLRHIEEALLSNDHIKKLLKNNRLRRTLALFIAMLFILTDTSQLMAALSEEEGVSYDYSSYDEYEKYDEGYGYFSYELAYESYGDGSLDDGPPDDFYGYWEEHFPIPVGAMAAFGGVTPAMASPVFPSAFPQVTTPPLSPAATIEISTPSELAAFLDGAGPDNGHFLITNDINMAGHPVDGGRAGIFSGILDGAGHTVSNLRVNPTDSHPLSVLAGAFPSERLSNGARGLGLIQNLGDNGRVRNLTLHDFYFRNNLETGNTQATPGNANSPGGSAVGERWNGIRNNYVGAFVGIVSSGNAFLENVHLTGTTHFVNDVILTGTVVPDASAGLNHANQTLEMTVRRQSFGGLVGAVLGGNLTVRNVTVADFHFEVGHGSRNLGGPGGLGGGAAAATMNYRDGGAPNAVGGFIGYVHGGIVNIDSQSGPNRNTIAMRTTTAVGNFIGTGAVGTQIRNALASHSQRIRYVGGVIGRVDSGSITINNVTTTPNSPTNTNAAYLDGGLIAYHPPYHNANGFHIIASRRAGGIIAYSRANNVNISNVFNALNMRVLNDRNGTGDGPGGNNATERGGHPGSFGNAGGIVGRSNGGGLSIRNAGNVGNVVAHGIHHTTLTNLQGAQTFNSIASRNQNNSGVGGIVGHSFGTGLTINASFNAGSIDGNHSGVGGILGHNAAGNTTITDVYHIGNVSSFARTGGNGLVGRNRVGHVTISNAFVAGSVTGFAVGARHMGNNPGGGISANRLGGFTLSNIYVDFEVITPNHVGNFLGNEEGFRIPPTGVHAANQDRTQSVSNIGPSANISAVTSELLTRGTLPGISPAEGNPWRIGLYGALVTAYRTLPYFYWQVTNMPSDQTAHMQPIFFTSAHPSVGSIFMSSPDGSYNRNAMFTGIYGVTSATGNPYRFFNTYRDPRFSRLTDGAHITSPQEHSPITSVGTALNPNTPSFIRPPALRTSVGIMNPMGIVGFGMGPLPQRLDIRVLDYYTREYLPSSQIFLRHTVPGFDVSGAFGSFFFEDHMHANAGAGIVTARVPHFRPYNFGEMVRYYLYDGDTLHGDATDYIYTLETREYIDYRVTQETIERGYIEFLFRNVYDEDIYAWLRHPQTPTQVDNNVPGFSMIYPNPLFIRGEGNYPPHPSDPPLWFIDRNTDASHSFVHDPDSDVPTFEHMHFFLEDLNEGELLRGGFPGSGYELLAINHSGMYLRWRYTDESVSPTDSDPFLNRRGHWHLDIYPEYVNLAYPPRLRIENMGYPVVGAAHMWDPGTHGVAGDVIPNGPPNTFLIDPSYIHVEIVHSHHAVAGVPVPVMGTGTNAPSLDPADPDYWRYGLNMGTRGETLTHEWDAMGPFFSLQNATRDSLITVTFLGPLSAYFLPVTFILRDLYEELVEPHFDPFIPYYEADFYGTEAQLANFLASHRHITVEAHPRLGDFEFHIYEEVLGVGLVPLPGRLYRNSNYIGGPLHPYRTSDSTFAGVEIAVNTEIMATAPGFANGFAFIDPTALPADGIFQIVLNRTNPDTGFFFGRVLYNMPSNPYAPYAWVYLINAEGRLYRRTQASSTGTFMFENLSPGDYRILAANEGGTYRKAFHSFTMYEGASFNRHVYINAVDEDTSKYKLLVTVIEGGTGNPLEDISVNFNSTPLNFEDGLFTLISGEPIAGSLSVDETDDFEEVVRIIDSSNFEGNVKLVTLVLVPNYQALHFTIQNAVGLPIFGASVSIPALGESNIPIESVTNHYGDVVYHGIIRLTEGDRISPGETSSFHFIVTPPGGLQIYVGYITLSYTDTVHGFRRVGHGSLLEDGHPAIPGEGSARTIYNVVLPPANPVYVQKVIYGRVFGPDTAPLPNATVAMLDNESVYVYTDAGGFYVFILEVPVFLATDYTMVTLFANHQNYNPSVETIMASITEPTRQDFNLTDGDYELIILYGIVEVEIPGGLRVPASDSTLIIGGEEVTTNSAGFFYILLPYDPDPNFVTDALVTVGALTPQYIPNIWPDSVETVSGIRRDFVVFVNYIPIPPEEPTVTVVVRGVREDSPDTNAFFEFSLEALPGDIIDGIHLPLTVGSFYIVQDGNVNPTIVIPSGWNTDDVFYHFVYYEYLGMGYTVVTVYRLLYGSDTNVTAPEHIPWQAGTPFAVDAGDVIGYSLHENSPLFKGTNSVIENQTFTFYFTSRPEPDDGYVVIDILKTDFTFEPIRTVVRRIFTQVPETGGTVYRRSDLMIPYYVPYQESTTYVQWYPGDPYEVEFLYVRELAEIDVLGIYYPENTVFFKQPTSAFLGTVYTLFAPTAPSGRNLVGAPLRPVFASGPGIVERFYFTPAVPNQITVNSYEDLGGGEYLLIDTFVLVLPLGAEPRIDRPDIPDYVGIGPSYKEVTIDDDPNQSISFFFTREMVRVEVELRDISTNNVIGTDFVYVRKNDFNQVIAPPAPEGFTQVGHSSLIVRGTGEGDLIWFYYLSDMPPIVDPPVPEPNYVQIYIIKSTPMETVVSGTFSIVDVLTIPVGSHPAGSLVNIQAPNFEGYTLDIYGSSLNLQFQPNQYLDTPVFSVLVDIADNEVGPIFIRLIYTRNVLEDILTINLVEYGTGESLGTITTEARIGSAISALIPYVPGFSFYRTGPDDFVSPYNNFFVTVNPFTGDSITLYYIPHPADYDITVHQYIDAVRVRTDKVSLSELSTISIPNLENAYLNFDVSNPSLPFNILDVISTGVIPPSAIEVLSGIDEISLFFSSERVQIYLAPYVDDVPASFDGGFYVSSNWLFRLGLSANISRFIYDIPEEYTLVSSFPMVIFPTRSSENYENGVYTVRVLFDVEEEEEVPPVNDEAILVIHFFDVDTIPADGNVRNADIIFARLVYGIQGQYQLYTISQNPMILGTSWELSPMGSIQYFLYSGDEMQHTLGIPTIPVNRIRISLDDAINTLWIPYRNTAAESSIVPATMALIEPIITSPYGVINHIVRDGSASQIIRTEAINSPYLREAIYRFLLNEMIYEESYYILEIYLEEEEEYYYVITVYIPSESEYEYEVYYDEIKIEIEIYETEIYETEIEIEIEEVYEEAYEIYEIYETIQVSNTDFLTSAVMASLLQGLDITNVELYELLSFLDIYSPELSSSIRALIETYYYSFDYIEVSGENITVFYRGIISANTEVSGTFIVYHNIPSLGDRQHFGQTVGVVDGSLPEGHNLHLSVNALLALASGDRPLQAKLFNLRPAGYTIYDGYVVLNYKSVITIDDLPNAGRYDVLVAAAIDNNMSYLLDIHPNILPTHMPVELDLAFGFYEFMTFFNTSFVAPTTVNDISSMTGGRLVKDNIVHTLTGVKVFDGHKQEYVPVDTSIGSFFETSTNVNPVIFVFTQDTEESVTPPPPLPPTITPPVITPTPPQAQEPTPLPVPPQLPTTPPASGGTLVISNVRPQPTPPTTSEIPTNEPVINRAFRYVQGFTDQTFRANSGITRAEMAQMFFNLSVNPNRFGHSFTNFADVSEQGWYFEAISYFATSGVLVGFPDGYFRPNQYITNAEFAQFLSGVLGLTSVSNESYITGHWSYEAVNATFNSTLFAYFEGNNTYNFEEDAIITRAQAVTTINYHIGRTVDRNGINAYLQARQIYGDLTSSHWAFYQIMAATLDHLYAYDSDGNSYWVLNGGNNGSHGWVGLLRGN